jgi:hypothetical protein
MALINGDLRLINQKRAAFSAPGRRDRLAAVSR